MKFKKVIQGALLVGFYAGSAFLIYMFYHASAGLENKPFLKGQVNTVAGEVRTGLPVRLKIPVINLDVMVENVGVTADGAMDVPKSAANVGWFTQGPRPGEAGSAVIDGHMSQRNGLGGPFSNLYKLKLGDIIFIKNDQGESLKFIVRKIRSYLPDADTATIFAQNDGINHMNLITCGGAWDKVRHSYPNRLVVFTDQITNGT